MSSLSEKPYISRKEQAQLTKKKIFDTTLLLIRRRGYGKITIREICQNAQISIGTFYLYFSSKDDILLEMYDKIDYRVSFPAKEEKEDVISVICRNFNIYLSQATDMLEKDLLREVYRGALNSGSNYFLNPERPLYKAVYENLHSAGKTDGFKISISPDDLCHKIFVFVQSYVFEWLMNNDLTPAFLTDTCIRDLSVFLTLYL